MKTLGNLDLCGNSIVGVSQILDTEGNPIGAGSGSGAGSGNGESGGSSVQSGMPFRMFRGNFSSNDDSFGEDTDTDSNGNTIYYKTYTAEGSTHRVVFPVALLFEYVSGTLKQVNADIEIADDSTNNITFKFIADENYDVADWADGYIHSYKYVVIGLEGGFGGEVSGNGDADDNQGSGSGSGSGSGDGE